MVFSIGIKSIMRAHVCDLGYVLVFMLVICKLYFVQWRCIVTSENQCTHHSIRGLLPNCQPMGTMLYARPYGCLPKLPRYRFAGCVCSMFVNCRYHVVNCRASVFKLQNTCLLFAGLMFVNYRSHALHCTVRVFKL